MTGNQLFKPPNLETFDLASTWLDDDYVKAGTRHYQQRNVRPVIPMKQLIVDDDYSWVIGFLYENTIMTTVPHRS